MSMYSYVNTKQNKKSKGNFILAAGITIGSWRKYFIFQQKYNGHIHPICRMRIYYINKTQ